MLGEQVDYVCDPILGPLPHVRAGTLKAMAIATSKRHPALPDVPTSAEGGLPNFQAAPFYAMFAPKGTPQPIIEKLAAAIDKGLDERDVTQAAARSRRRDHREEGSRTEGRWRRGARARSRGSRRS